jgi:DNA-binding response OmpR family regulator
MQMVHSHADYCTKCNRPYDVEGRPVSYAGISIELGKRSYLLDGRPIELTQQQAQFLYLVFSNGRVSTDSLILFLCPDSLSARNQVHVIASRTKKRLLEQGVKASPFRSVKQWGFEIAA